ncbi:MAG: YtcA family lipoprotein [Chthoniobacterales bacterium]|jgi:hypothetical protein
MSRWILLPAAFVILTMTGCDPQINIAGAYFPAWLACTLGGLILFWVLHLVFLKAGLLPYLIPLPLVYGALITSLTCILWLLFFAVK